MAGSIGVVRRALVGGVLRGGSDGARRLAFVTVFGTKVVVACLPTPAPVGVVDEFRLLRAFFYRSERASIRFSSESSDWHRVASLW